MALENDDLIVVQKSGGGELRKAKVGDIKPDIPDALWTEDSGQLYPTTLTNNVGIGTDSPDELFHVQGSGNTTAKVSSSRDDRFARFLFQSENQFIVGYGPSHSSQPNELSLKNYWANGKINFFTTETDGTGTERLTIINNGNVGIGIDSPSSKLEVVGFIQSSQGLKFNDTDSAYGLFPLGSQTLAFNINSDEKVRITSAGNVGIGTDSPAAKLHVEGGDQILKSAYDASGTKDVKLYFSSRHSGNWRNASISLTDESDFVFTNGGTGADPTVAGTEKMRIDGAGNLGIGTDSPSSLLHLSGAPYLTLSNTAAGTDLKNWMISGGSDGKLRFRSGTDAFAYSNVVTVDHVGNVGIGTDSPAELLHLRSDSSALRIDSNRVGTDFNNAGIVFGTPRNNTSDNGTNPGRGALVNLGNGSPDNVHGTTWLLAASSGLNTTSTDDEYKNKQCGLRLSSDGSLEHWVQNNLRLVVTNAGDVGIGTDSPAQKLHVNGVVQVDNQIRAWSNNETCRFKTQRTTGDFFTLWNGATSVNDGTKIADIDAAGKITVKDYNLEALPSLP